MALWRLVMTRISTFWVLKIALVIVVIVPLVFGLVPLTLAPAEAGHGGGNAPSHSSGKATPEVAVPQPVAPQPPRLQGIQFQPDSRCAQLTAAQRRQTPGCGYN
jgi:hypothetical protein